MKRLILTLFIVLSVISLPGASQVSGAGPKPDLAIHTWTMLFDPVNRAHVTVTVYAVNDGDAAAGPFTLQWYADSNLLAGTQAFKGLGAGETTSITADYTYPALNVIAHQRGVVDSAHQVAESNEDNNVFERDYYVGANTTTDLIVKEAHFEPSPVISGQPFQAVVTIQNVGLTGSSQKFVKVLWEFHAVTGLEDCVWNLDQSLTPGMEQRLTCARTTNAQAGQSPTVVTVDANHTTGENNEDNNVAKPALVVSLGTAGDKPDLVVQDAHFEPEPVVAGQAFKAKVTVTNQGVHDAGPFSVRWHFHAATGLEDCVFKVDAYTRRGVQQRMECTRTTNSPPGGSPTELTLDINSQVDEGNEANNVSNPRLNVVATKGGKPPPTPTGKPPLTPTGKADLAIRDLAVAPDTIKPGQGFKVDFNVVNQGKGPAGPSKARWETPADAGLSKTCDVPALKPGDEHHCSFTFSKGPAKPGKYPTTATADAGQSVDEALEGNNQMKALLTVKK